MLQQQGGKFMSAHFDGWPHIVRSQQFSREWIEEELFPLAREMKKVFEVGGCDILRGKRMVSLFYQPSTRTRGSFQMAMSYLGGEISFATENAAKFSSAEKGESFEHTIKVWCRYRPDVIVLRHDKEGSAETAAKVSSVPIINAGDGPGQHPTQGLLDIFTIQEKLKRIDGISIAINGDLINNRAARSLAYLLSKFNEVRIYFVSPPAQKMRQDVLDHLNEKGVCFSESERLEEVIPLVDAVYMLRTQREHGSNVYDLTNQYVLDEDTARLAKETAIFMHPLPIDSRVKEIRPEIEKDPRAVFLSDEIDSGLYTRMALLKMVMAP
jgi:aspartate carbamoyltransferase catalytic subunit